MNGYFIHTNFKKNLKIFFLEATKHLSIATLPNKVLPSKNVKASFIGGLLKAIFELATCQVAECGPRMLGFRLLFSWNYPSPSSKWCHSKRQVERITAYSSSK